jgi:LAO/AO transport system kinase
VLTCSSLNNTGIAEIWKMVLEHEAQLGKSGRIAERRSRGDLQWMEDLISMGLAESFQSQPAVAERLPALRQDVHDGRATPLAAARLVRRPQRRLDQAGTTGAMTVGKSSRRLKLPQT